MHYNAFCAFADTTDARPMLNAFHKQELPTMRDPRTIRNLSRKQIVTIANAASKPKEKELPERHCKDCDRAFKPVREWQLFCSSACRTNFYKAALARQVQELEEENRVLRAENETLKLQIALQDK